MAKKHFYDSIEDSYKRLNDTVVMCRGRPAVITQIQGLNTDQIATARILPGNDVEEHPLTREYFEVRDLPPLGYTDYKGWSYYLARVPIRQGRQGYNIDTTHVPMGPHEYCPDFKTLVKTKEFTNMLLNKYPSFKDCFDKVIDLDDQISLSFNKTFCLFVDDLGTVSLGHRGQTVAVCTNPKKHGAIFRLPKKFGYLAEELQESRIQVEA